MCRSPLNLDRTPMPNSPGLSAEKPDVTPRIPALQQVAREGAEFASHPPSPVRKKTCVNSLNQRWLRHEFC
jgi:hypothetical protein